MTYEGQAINEPRTSYWRTAWRLETLTPEEATKQLEPELKAEGLDYSIGIYRCHTEESTSYREDDGRWIPIPMKIIRAPGAILVSIRSAQTSQRVLVRRHSIFKTWLEPTTQTHDGFEEARLALVRAWARSRLPEPTFMDQTPIAAPIEA